MHLHRFEVTEIAGIPFGRCKKCGKVRRFLYFMDRFKWFPTDERFWEYWAMEGGK